MDTKILKNYLITEMSPKQQYLSKNDLKVFSLEIQSLSL